MNTFTRTTYNLFLTTLICLLSLTFSQAQETLREISLTQQVNASTSVIEGEVISKASYWDSDYSNIYTVNTIKVFKVFKGENYAIIELITPGGTVEDMAQITVPSLQLRKGDIGVFTLENASNKLVSSKVISKLFKPYSSVQGFYKYDLNTNFAVNTFSKKGNISSYFYEEIERLTKTKYKEIARFNVDLEYAKTNKSKASLAPSNINFSPSNISAGTGSQLTITGNDFGSIKGKVSFRNTEDGGATYIDALDSQVTWSPSQITVEVPSFAGTGTIRVTDSNGDFSESTNQLTVTYALINQISNGVAYPLQAYGANGSGGFTWRKNSAFTANSDANVAFTTAFNAWRCETGVNWVIGADTNVSIAANDAENVIAFSTLPAGNLGVTTYYLGSCNGSTDWFVQSMDMIFDNTASSPWNFDPNPNTTGFEYDFQSVALHELGHAHLLDHVIDDTDVMDFNIGLAQESRQLDSNNIISANLIQTRNTTNIVCALPLMTNYNCPTASIEDEELITDINIYPNPTTGQFYIKSGASVNLDKVVIYDVSGRLISSIDVSSTSGVKTINLPRVKKGLYFVNLHDENRMITKKLIVE